jgi:type VI secretion system protein ImpK
MKLPELCEPLFQYICRLNRSARKGGKHSADQVRNEIKNILADMQAKAKPDVTLATHLDKSRGGIYLVLLFFVDFMIRKSKLTFAGDWASLAKEEQEPDGDQKFFDMLGRALADHSDAAADRILIYYTCMGLGFTGVYQDEPDYLRRKMLECSARLRGLINADDAEKVCPEAYNPDTRELFKPIGSSLVGMSIVLFVLLITVLAANGYQYLQKSRELTQTLDKLKSGPVAGAATQPAAGPATAPTAAAQ